MDLTSYQSSRPRNGFSLLEVAIALVIFVIGALVILRIFPTGLGLVEKSADMRRADNLNASALARYRATASFPEGVYNTDSTGWVAFNGFISRSASPKFNEVSSSLPISTKSTDYAASALPNFTAITGEKPRIVQVGSQNYALTQFSIGRLLSVYEDSVVLGARLSQPTPSDPFVLTFDDAILENGDDFLPSAGDLLLVSFNYQSAQLGTSATWRQNEQVVPYTSGTVEVKKPSSDAVPLTAGVEVTWRRFIVLPSTPNPDLVRAGIFQLPTISPGEEDSVRVNYVANWNLILQESLPSLATDPGFPSNPGNSQVPLAIPLIQTRGSGITVAAVTPTQIGAMQYRGEATPATPAPDNFFSYIKPLNSDVRFISRAGNIGLRGLSGDAFVRVAYRTRDDWTQQLSVAAKTYKKFDGSGLERWRDYDILATTPSPTLVFHASEAGKSVRVAYLYKENSTDLEIRKGEDILLIPEKTEVNTLGLLGTTTPPPTVAQVILNAPGPSGPIPGVVIAIQSVNGESVNMRTAWLDSTRYNQSLLTSLRGESS